MKKCVLTTSNINYISRVNVLAKSIIEKHGPIDIYNIVVDDYSEDAKNLIKNQNFPFTPIFLDELNIDKVRESFNRRKSLFERLYKIYFCIYFRKIY